MVARLVRDFIRNDSGATAIEYGLIAGMIAVGILIALTAFGGAIQGMFGRIQTKAGGAMDNAGI